jgi:Sigma-54 interaction domain
MEISSHPFVETSPLTKDRNSSPRLVINLARGRNFIKTSIAGQAEWTILHTSPVNALLVGARPLTAAAVARIERSVRQPVVWWSPDQTAEIPDMRSGTLVIRDADRLDVEQQQRLAQWIGVHTSQVQVLALAQQPLFAQVAAGRFSAVLYYRMNTVVVEMRTQADLP